MDNMIVEEAEPVQENSFLAFAPHCLPYLCNVVTFAELKLFRLVCRNWNQICMNHHRFHSAHGKLGTSWDKNCETLSISRFKTWATMTLSNFALHQSKIFTLYWAGVEGQLKVLNLNGLKVSCTQMCQTLKNCVMLESITFYHIGFTYSQILRPLTEEQAQQIENAQRVPWESLGIPRYKVCCPHTNFTPDANVLPTIKSIVIARQNSFPLCVLDLLAQRSAGKLETFCIEFINPSHMDNHFHHNHRENENMLGNEYPTILQTLPFFQRICEQSLATLKTFNWLRNGNVATATAMLGWGLNLEKFSFGENWQERLNLNVPLVNFLRRQPLLTELRISCYCSQELCEQLANALPTLPHLRKIVFQINSNEHRHHRSADLDFLTTLTQLQDLEVSDHSYVHRGGRFFHAPINIDSNYMTHLPASVRKFGLRHPLHRHNFRNIFLNPTTFTHMSKLIITIGTYVTNDIMQVLIINLAQLEEMTIKNAKDLTDAGITGLDRVACNQLIQCNSHSLLLKPPASTDQQRHALNDMTMLRELNLSGCSKISDISACYAFRFPELQKLTLNHCNISDISLISLGTHNPKLKTLSIKHNRRVSYVGFNRLLEISKSIRQILTSEVIANRLSTVLCNVKQHSHFNDVVKTKSSKAGVRDDWTHT